jgi:predicted  nucleic acid-binding Zn-ribbon protein
MQPHSTDRRLERLEKRVTVLEDLPRRIDNLASEVSDLRDEVSELRDDVSELRGEVSDLRGEVSDLRGEVSGLRDEMHTGFAALDEKIRAGDDETRRHTRILHEDVIQRLALLYEGRDPRSLPGPNFRE